MSVNLTSTAFSHEGEIPRRYTCDGDDVSPPLSWSGIPTGARSLALVVDDPDAPDPAAPKMTWVHWVLYNLPPETTGLPEAATDSALSDGTQQGRNDWKRSAYGGPCPPIGRHRYLFKLYALDCRLAELSQADKAGLERAMQGHILAQATLIGTYQH
jgi:Raf kinase inhibitor-like YbhB/YbcL family protein